MRSRKGLRARRPGEGFSNAGEEREVRDHLARCDGCRELYEKEIELNAYLGSLELSRVGSRSVSRGVAMALPTRSAGRRVAWGSLAIVLLVASAISLGVEGVEPVILAMGVLGTCWAMVSGSAEALRAVLDAAGPTILLLLILGAVADVLIALVVFLGRRRRAQEA